MLVMSGSGLVMGGFGWLWGGYWVVMGGYRLVMSGYGWFWVVIRGYWRSLVVKVFFIDDGVVMRS